MTIPNVFHLTKNNIMPAKGQKKVTVKFLKGKSVKIVKKGNRKSILLQKGKKECFYCSVKDNISFINSSKGNVQLKLNSTLYEANKQMSLNPMKPIKVKMQGRCSLKACDIENITDSNQFYAIPNSNGNLIYCYPGSNQIKVVNKSSCKIKTVFYYNNQEIGTCNLSTSSAVGVTSITVPN